LRPLHLRLRRCRRNAEESRRRLVMRQRPYCGRGAEQDEDERDE
jgi:hypothetical protein